jgi:hypothetical protein
MEFKPVPKGGIDDCRHGEIQRNTLSSMSFSKPRRITISKRLDDHSLLLARQLTLGEENYEKTQCIWIEAEGERKGRGEKAKN